MTVRHFRPLLRRRRLDPWRALGAALCLSCATATAILIVWALAAVAALGAVR